MFIQKFGNITRNGLVRLNGGLNPIQKRFLNIHEYASMQVLRKYDVPTPNNILCTSPEETKANFEKFGKKDVVIKAQVLAGGRGI